ncbi:MAG: hypothetical protein KKE57_02865, partial [Proteobacteria bacterium]|nr:hypothetical protein [Pseudomonadota bacterium]
MAGLVYSWACVIAAAIQILLTARKEKGTYEISMPFLKRVSPNGFLFGITLATALIGWLALYGYSYLFAFYGLFLSVFAEMEPHCFFGRNGFINSDFVTPVIYLIGKFWPMILGTLIANADDFAQTKTWKRILLPFKSNEILRIHILTLALPFLTLIAWALFRTAYQPITLVLLVGLFYLLPKKRQKIKTGIRQNSDQTSE